MNKSVKTPCIGVCSTGLGDDVCRGCKRFQHEVLQWNSYSDSEKISVLNRLEILKTQIMESKVFIFDEALLKNQLETLKIIFNPETNSYCWVFDLFRFASQSISDPSEFGFEIVTKETNNILILKKIIEEELFELSEAHYQRYFNLEDNFNA
tara:strand:+ start:366 stop:821 length:456 start_codon:yes stop_codon:yes gene_type:complete